jgi:hypothetical protein
MEKNIDYDKIKELTTKQCSILYKNDCGWCVNYGWYDLIRDFSLKCEELNIMYYNRYRYRIVLDQIKEKYGRLRIYFSIVKDPPKVINWVIKMVTILKDLISPVKINYNIKRVYTQHPHTAITFSKSTENDNIVSIINNIKIKTEIVHHLGKQRDIPQKFKMLYQIYRLLNYIVVKTEIYFQYNFDQTDVIYDIMYNNVRELVIKYEKQSEDICCECGIHIGTAYSKKCVTSGWIRFMCESCAKKQNSVYYIKRTKFLKGKKLNSKNEHE